MNHDTTFQESAKISTLYKKKGGRLPQRHIIWIQVCCTTIKLHDMECSHFPPKNHPRSSRRCIWLWYISPHDESHSV